MNVPTHLTLLLALATILWTTATFADHYNCSWAAHKGSPGNFNYTQFCRAQMLLDNTDPHYADWVCAAGNVAYVGTKVADWSRLRKNILELATPCAKHGYGVNDEGTCVGGTWSMCWGPSTEGNCLYMKATDDCEWPNEQQSNKLPQEINIWFHPGRGFEEEE